MSSPNLSEHTSNGPPPAMHEVNSGIGIMNMDSPDAHADREKMHVVKSGIGLWDMEHMDDDFDTSAYTAARPAAAAAAADIEDGTDIDGDDETELTPLSQQWHRTSRTAPVPAPTSKPDKATSLVTSRTARVLLAGVGFMADSYVSVRGSICIDVD